MVDAILLVGMTIIGDVVTFTGLKIIGTALSVVGLETGDTRSLAALGRV